MAPSPSSSASEKKDLKSSDEFDKKDMTCSSSCKVVETPLNSSGDKVFRVDEKAMPSFSSSGPKTIFLKTDDGEAFELDEFIASQCQAIKHIVEDLDGSTHVIPVAGVSGDVLTRVLWYCKKHAENPNTGDKTVKEELKQWDKEFLKMDQKTLYDIILAANYLAVKDLLDLTLQCVADMIKGKKPKEIRETLGIVNDLPPEKEAQIRKDFYWLDFD